MGSKTKYLRQVYWLFNFYTQYLYFTFIIYHSQLLGHKKPVNCCSWNKNGNWLSTGAKDGLIKIYDIRMMKETEVLRGHNSDVCSMSWHPYYDNLLCSGAYNGSIIYWLVNHNQVKKLHR